MNKFITTLALIGALAFTGCETSTPQQQALTGDFIETIAQIGTSSTLIAEPQYKPEFLAAGLAFTTLSGSTNVTAAQISGVLSSLNVGGNLATAEAANLLALLNLGGQIAATSTNTATLQLYAGKLGAGISNGVVLSGK